MPATAPSLLSKIIAYIMGAGLLMAGLMFSVFAFALVAVAGIALWVWFKWKTRHLRRAMAEAARATPAATPSAAGQVIDGEARRVDQATGRIRHLS